jgi:hypothetical protein
MWNGRREGETITTKDAREVTLARAVRICDEFVRFLSSMQKM